MKVSKRIFELETESAFAILAKANKLISEGKDVINLGIGQPDFKTPLNIQEAEIKAIKDGHHGYTPSNGIIELREAVSEIVDSDSFFEVQKDYAENIVVGFARLAGRSVGVVANQPAFLAGVLDIHASIKAAR